MEWNRILRARRTRREDEMGALARAVDKVAAAGASAMRMKASAGASAGANGAPNSLRETIASAMTRGGGAVGASTSSEMNPSARHAPIGVKFMSSGRAARPLLPTVGKRTVA